MKVDAILERTRWPWLGGVVMQAPTAAEVLEVPFDERKRFLEGNRFVVAWEAEVDLRHRGVGIAIEVPEQFYRTGIVQDLRDAVMKEVMKVAKR